jgi:DNA polymerase-3 subunit delta'
MSWHSIRGHDRAVDALRRVLAQGRLPHAFLFVGPEGIGKRSFAEAFAQALLCERVPEAELDPCGVCPSCLQVVAGTHPDVHRVARPEDKHDLSIKQIRDLCLDLGLKPAGGRRKVAIVDDADDLNDEASNAFLKTLEEPPPGSVLILIGTSSETQLDTIVSRCRVLRFDPIPEAELAKVLIDQGVTDDPAEASRLAHLADGSVARARGLADATFDSFRRLLIDDLADPRGFDAPALSRRMGTFIDEAGKDSAPRRERARLLIGELARFFRGLLWQTAGVAPPAPDPDDRRAVEILAARVEPEDVFLLADRCLEADYHVGRKVYMPLILDALMHDLAKLINPHARG